MNGQEPTEPGQAPTTPAGGQESPQPDKDKQSSLEGLSTDELVALVRELRSEAAGRRVSENDVKTKLQEAQERLATFEAQEAEKREADLSAQQLAEERKAQLQQVKEERDALAEQIEQRDKVLQAMYQQERELVPEVYRPLLDSMTLPDALQYIADHKNELQKAHKSPNGVSPTPDPQGIGRLTPEERRKRAAKTW